MMHWLQHVHNTPRALPSVPRRPLAAQTLRAWLFSNLDSVEAKPPFSLPQEDPSLAVSSGPRGARSPYYSMYYICMMYKDRSLLLLPGVNTLIWLEGTWTPPECWVCPVWYGVLLGSGWLV